MSSSIPDLSALRCIRSQTPTSETEKLTHWTVEHVDSPTNSIQHTHNHFNPQTGVYTIPIDGIYLVEVQIIPIGGAILHNHRQTRKQVNYALHILEPLGYDEYLDIGSYSFGHMVHIRAGTTISCLRMAGANDLDCIRLKLCCVQLKKKKKKKKKKTLNRKDMRRRKRATTRGLRMHFEGSEDGVGDDGVGDDSDTMWEQGFESDCTSE